jgi:hypothetical protein
MFCVNVSANAPEAGTNQVQQTSATSETISGVSVSGNTITIYGEVSVANGAADGTLVFAYENGGVRKTVSYDASSSSSLVIKQSGYSTLYLNLDNGAGLDSIQIDVAVVKTAKGNSAAEVMDLSGAALEINAEQVIFDTAKGLTLKAESLNIELKDNLEAELVVSKIAAKTLKVHFKNFNVEAEGSFKVEGSVTESSIAEETKDVNWGDEVIEVLRLLTHDPSVPYMDYVAKIAENQVAKRVKIADLTHNSDNTRLDYIDEYAKARCEKYKRALELLNSSK